MSEEIRGEIKAVQERQGEHRERIKAAEVRLDGHADRLKELDQRKVDVAEYRLIKRLILALASLGLSGWAAWFGKILGAIK